MYGGPKCNSTLGSYHTKSEFHFNIALHMKDALDRIYKSGDQAQMAKQPEQLAPLNQRLGLTEILRKATL